MATAVASAPPGEQAMPVPSSSSPPDLISGLSPYDPLLELCPSIDSLRAIIRRSQRLATQATESPQGAKGDSADIELHARLARSLLRAASSGDTELLAWLLQPAFAARRNAGLVPDSPPAHSTDFEWAALRKLGLDVRDDDGTGPMVLASSAGHVDAVKLLVQAGADVDERDAYGWTPLMWATNSSNAPLVGFLLSNGADPEARSFKGISCEDFILSSAPEAGTSMTDRGAGPSRLPSAYEAKSPTSTDRELIADMIYDHLQMTSVEKASRGGPKSSVASFVSAASAASTRSAEPRSPSPTKTGMARGAGLLSPSPSPLPASPSGHGRTPSSASGMRRLLGRDERVQLAEAELRARELAEGRRRALLDVAVMLEVDYDSLLGEPPAQEAEERASWAARKSMRQKAGRRSSKPKTAHTGGLSSGCGAAEVGADVLSVEFDWERVRPEQMLVLGVSEATLLLDMVLVGAKPVRAPWVTRASPANTLFIALRYACSVDDEELLEELVLGAVDRIEAEVYAHPTSMTHLAFWLYNCLLLLHYAQRDVTLRHSEAMDEYRMLLADLVNEVYVFVIRDAERRIDKVMDAALLDHDAIPGFDEVRFEGEWKFMKSLTGSVKNLGGGGGSIGASGGSSSSGGSTLNARASLSQIFARRDITPTPDSPARGGGSGGSAPGSNGANTPSGHAGLPSSPPQSRAETPFRATLQAASPQSSPLRAPPLSLNRSASSDAAATDLLAKPSPRTITTLLTSTLHVLQLYEINPAIIVQALSQVFFWTGCELFNRILTRKKHLCRSRAMQIRMNVSALEDWARSNALPLSIVTSHLSPVTQLVGWIQCQSSLQDFDGLVATMQGLRTLNPLQMRRVVRDYRYEVGEGRMSDECLQYLGQVQKDWERRRDETAEAAREREAELRAAKAQMAKMKRELKAHGSHHQRSATATQEEQDKKSRRAKGLGIGSGGGVAGSESADEDDEGPDEGSDVEGDDTLDGRGAAGGIEATDDILLTTDEIARKAQVAIDSLFAPGRSMADYVPPWTAAGAPPGAQGEIACNATDGSPLGELLNSRDMLPFALPTRTEALIVSPGDAFGFGRGHFQGTGTPSLRSIRAFSPSPLAMASGAGPGGGSLGGAFTPLSDANSRPGSPLAGVNGSTDADEVRSTADSDGPDGGGAAGSSAASSSARSSASAASRTSSLYPLGKGFAAGAYWQPVPVLPEDLLSRIDDEMRKLRPPIPAERRSNVVIGSAAGAKGGGPTSYMTSPIMESGAGGTHTKGLAVSSGDAVAEGGERRPGLERQSTLRASNASKPPDKGLPGADASDADASQEASAESQDQSSPIAAPSKHQKHQRQPSGLSALPVAAAAKVGRRSGGLDEEVQELDE